MFSSEVSRLYRRRRGYGQVPRGTTNYHSPEGSKQILHYLPQAGNDDIKGALSIGLGQVNIGAQQSTVVQYSCTSILLSYFSCYGTQTGGRNSFYKLQLTMIFFVRW